METNNHVVKLYDVIVEGEIKVGNTVHFFLVMELMKTDLASLLFL